MRKDVAVERVDQRVVDIRREHAFAQVVENDNCRGAAETTKRLLV